MSSIPDTRGLSDVAGARASLSATRRQLFRLLPLGAFAGLAAVFAARLGDDPSILPSALMGDPVPEFALPPVRGRTLGLSSGDLKGDVSLVNVFASWCTACRYEHPLFMEIKKNGTVPLHGLNYKDEPENAEEWLDTLGDPYLRTGADLNGRVAIDWGVYGVPETFVVGPDGIIRHKHIGPLTEEALNGTILPLVERLRAEPGGSVS